MRTSHLFLVIAVTKPEKYLFFFFLNSFIEIYLIYHTIHSLKAHHQCWGFVVVTVLDGLWSVAGLIPSQGTCLGFRPGPQWGVCVRGNHTLMSLFPLSPSLPLSLKTKTNKQKNPCCVGGNAQCWEYKEILFVLEKQFNWQVNRSQMLICRFQVVRGTDREYHHILQQAYLKEPGFGGILTEGSW